MIPESKAAEALNSLVDVLKNFEPQRNYLSPLHRQRIQGLVDRIPETSPAKPIARIMQACFFRDFDTAETELEQAATTAFNDSDLEVNVAKGLSETFQFNWFLSFIKSVISHRQDDPSFLYQTSYGLCAYGMYSLAWEFCCQLEKLNMEPHKYRGHIEQQAYKYQELGITDEAVANYLTEAMVPVRNFLAGNPQVSYRLSNEVFDDSDLDGIAFILRIDATTEEILDLSESISEHLSKSDLDDKVDELFAISVWGYAAEEYQHAS